MISLYGTICIRYGTTETQYCSQYNMLMQTIWHHDKNSSELNLSSIWMTIWKRATFRCQSQSYNGMLFTLELITRMGTNPKLEYNRIIFDSEFCFLRGMKCRYITSNYCQNLFIFVYCWIRKVCITFHGCMHFLDVELTLQFDLIMM